MDREQMSELPGSEIVIAGLDDLNAGRDSKHAAAVLMASERLRAAGVAVPESPGAAPIAAHHLYELLTAEQGAGAHSHYNAIIRRVASFARAAEHARSG